jgi:hypothetical protein
MATICSTTTPGSGRTRAAWVDHEHPTGPDHRVVEVGAAAGEGQVVQDRPPAPLQGLSSRAVRRFPTASHRSRPLAVLLGL